MNSIETSHVDGPCVIYVLKESTAPLPESVHLTLQHLAASGPLRVVCRPESLPAVRDALDQKQLSQVEAVPYKHVDHAGRTLLLGKRLAGEAPSVQVWDDTLLGPIPNSAITNLAVDEEAPVRALFGFDHGKGPLALEGGALNVYVPWLKSPRVRRALSSREARSWVGLGDQLRSLLGEEITARYPTSDHLPWIAGGLRNAVRNGAAFLPWKTFTADPLALTSFSIAPRLALEHLEARDYPTKAFWDQLLRAAEPQVWHANLELFTITDNQGSTVSAAAPGRGPRDGDANSAAESRAPLTTAVVMHVFYVDMLEEMLRFAGNVPPPAHLFITTDTDEKAQKIRAVAEKENYFEEVQVRVVGSNQGRDIPAFLIDCADVLTNPHFDLVVKLHSKKSAQTPDGIGTYFKDHLFENLVGTPSQAAKVKDLFEREPSLGLVFPPTIHMGHPTMGNGWMTNKFPAFSVARRLGFELDDATTPRLPSLTESPLPKVPADARTPLAPYGSMFWARREALTPLVDANFNYEEFPTNEAYMDGSLAHVLERLTAYTAYSQGFYARTVQTRTNAQFADQVLYAKLTAFDRALPLPPEEQLKWLESKKPFSLERLGVQVYSSLIRSSPAAAKAGKGAWRLLKSVRGAVTGKPQGDTLAD